MSHILSFDIEDWFHLLEIQEFEDPVQWPKLESRVVCYTNYILNVLRSKNLKATFFVVGWIAERYPELVKGILRDGHHLGTHSHVHRLAHEMTPLEFESDLCSSIEAIYNACGHLVDSYRAPGFSVTPKNFWVFEVLARNQIRFDSSLFISRRAHGGAKHLNLSAPSKLILPNGSDIVLFPVVAYSWLKLKIPYSGGGYFRLLPSSSLRGMYARSAYSMSYFHPRDFDFSQPRCENVSTFRRFKLYTGLRNSKTKFENLLSMHKFYSIEHYMINEPLPSKPIYELNNDNTIRQITD